MSRPFVECGALFLCPIVPLIDPDYAGSASAQMVHHRLGDFEAHAEALQPGRNRPAAGDDRSIRSHLCKRCSSQLSLTGHLNRGSHGIFKIVRVVSCGFVSIAEVHAKVARPHLA